MAWRSLLSLAPLHLVHFGLVLPYRTWRHHNVWPTSDAPRRSRVQHYKADLVHFASCGFISITTLFSLWLTASRTPIESHIFVFGRVVGTPRAVWGGLLPLEWPSLMSLGFGVVAFAVMVAIDLAYSRRCFDRDAPHMHAATPQTREEQAGWIAVSLAAGVTEELTWRGVQPELIAQLTGHLWPAVLICAATFGLGHIRQGKPFVLIAALFALTFHALTWLTGGLWVPMMVHVAMNVVVGLRAGMWVKQ
jgi:membrane protease YdiL (CAAX protease family)